MSSPTAETTPDIRQLFEAGQIDKPSAYFCGKCRMVIRCLEIHRDEEWHKEPPVSCYTCDSTRCNKCDLVVAPRSYCNPCSSLSSERRESEALNSAEVANDYDGPVWHDNEYHQSIEEIYDMEDRPYRVFCSTEHNPTLDVCEVLQEIEENSNVDDYEFNWTGIGELQAFVDRWMKEQAITWHEEDRSRCVEIEEPLL